MATVKLVLDKRRKDPLLVDATNKTDKNKYPLRIRIYNGDNTFEITLKYKFTTSEWLESENRVDKSYPSSTRVNNSILKRLSIVNTVLMDYESAIKNMDVTSVKKLIQNAIDAQIVPEEDQTAKKIIAESTSQEPSITLEKFGRILIERTRKKGSFDTAKWYEDGINSIKKFNNEKDIAISNITVSFLEDFEAEHLSKGNSKNGISAYLRAVRSVTNYAIREVFRNKQYEGYPWGKGYSIPSEKTKKRAVKKNIIESIRNMELEKYSALWDAQNYFLFMFNNRGMNFIDIAKLKAEQVIEAIYAEKQLIAGRIEYVRSKNKKDFSIKLTKESIKILNDYKIFEKAPEDLVFPIGFENSKTGLETYRQKRKRINERFRELAKNIGQEDIDLTTYVIRHSWASIARKSGVADNMIGDGLGHSDAKTTRIYLEEFENDILDDMNELIVS